VRANGVALEKKVSSRLLMRVRSRAAHRARARHKAAAYLFWLISHQ
jgi:hypothetical protein